LHKYQTFTTRACVTDNKGETPLCVVFQLQRILEVESDIDSGFASTYHARYSPVFPVHEKLSAISGASGSSFTAAVIQFVLFFFKFLLSGSLLQYISRVSYSAKNVS
jgi:hypothetical protein